MTGKEKRGMIILALSAAAVLAVSLSTGSAEISLREIILLFSGLKQDNSVAWTIITGIRLPKMLASAFGGGALALSGLLLQTFFRNPLAGPDVLGIASGAGLGAALVILAGQLLPVITATTVPASVAGAFAVTILLFFLVRKFENMTLTLITGLLAAYFLNSVTGILLRFAPSGAVRNYINWSAGSFRTASLEEMVFFIPLITASAAASFVISKKCDLYMFGDDYSVSMGLDIKKFRYTLIFLTSLMTGSVTAFCGPVAFIGIAAPHFCRFFLKTDRHRLLVPGVFLSGAVLASAADIVSALPGGGSVLPLNSVTALIGAPIVIKVLAGRQREG